MTLNLCACGVGYLVRLNRSFWMRLVPGRRHYYCVRCKTHQLLSRNNLRQAFPMLRPELGREFTGPAPLDDMSTASSLLAPATRPRRTVETAYRRR